MEKLFLILELRPSHQRVPAFSEMEHDSQSGVPELLLFEGPTIH